MSVPSVIKELEFSNITVFEKLRLAPSAGVNVVLGSNGTGKSHLLKLVYILHSFLSNPEHRQIESKQRYAERFSEAITRNFLVDSVGRLSSRVQGHKHSTVTMTSGGAAQRGASLQMDFSTRSTFAELNLGGPIELRAPVFIPSREMLSMFQGFLSSYRLGHVRAEEFYADLAAYLGVGGSPGKLPADLREYIGTLEGILDASIVYDAAREEFYIRQRGLGKIEIGLAADGHKKIGMIMHLIKNGAVRGGETVIVDEPEAHLNPSAARPIVELLLQLARNGNQVYVSTHDYFILKYFELLRAKYNDVGVQFLNLYREKKTDKFVQYETGSSLYDLEHDRVLHEFETIHKEAMTSFWQS